MKDAFSVLRWFFVLRIMTDIVSLIFFILCLWFLFHHREPITIEPAAEPAVHTVSVRSIIAHRYTIKVSEWSPIPRNQAWNRMVADMTESLPSFDALYKYLKKNEEQVEPPILDARALKSLDEIEKNLVMATKEVEVIRKELLKDGRTSR